MLSRLRRAAVALGRRCRDGATVLLYHRVARPAFDPQALAVSPENFAGHLELLRRHGTPLPLAELADRLERGALPRNAFAVTFDDGYADNLTEAAPILRRLEIPATVFVATATLGTEREFWWDELEGLIFVPASLPERLELKLGGQRRSWSLAEPAGTASPASPDWDLTRPDSPTPRHRLYREVCFLLKETDGRERETALAAIASWAGSGRSRRPSHRAMTPAEVRTLGAGGGIEIGAHTVSHSMLSRQTPEEQAREIEESKTRLEKLTGKPVASFAYPFGGTGDYSSETVAAARRAGLRRACANIPGLARRGADPFQLPRCLVRNWSAAELARRMAAWRWQ